MTEAPRPIAARPYGPRALLLEVDTPAEAATIVAAVDGVDEVVPGAVTVLVLHDGRPGIDTAVLDAVRHDLCGAADAGAARRSREVMTEVVIEVVYDGDDLAAVAAHTGQSVEDVVTAHTAATYEVAFCGFAPGFAYLTGVPTSLMVPRLATPRSRVPAGAVAIAGPYSAVYPSASPGGWNLLGRTAAAVWNIEADPPALLIPGTRVRFVAIDATS